MRKCRQASRSAEGVFAVVKLRELARRDLPVLNQWRNDPELVSYLCAPFRFIDGEVDARWYDNYLANRSRAVRCAITDEDDRLLGVAYLLNIDTLNQSAEFGFMVGDAEKRNRGIGSFALHALLEHGFYHMNLHRITSRVLESNPRSAHVFEKAGFRKEGIFRDALFKEGKFVSLFQYALLREEYGFHDKAQ